MCSTFGFLVRSLSLSLSLVIQVISARKGEFETGYERGGQTREHVQLAKTLGVSKLLVVVNKMDDPTVNWSKERCLTTFVFLSACFGSKSCLFAFLFNYSLFQV